MSANHSDCRYANRENRCPVTGSRYPTLFLLRRQFYLEFGRVRSAVPVVSSDCQHESSERIGTIRRQTRRDGARRVVDRKSFTDATFRRRIQPVAAVGVQKLELDVGQRVVDVTIAGVDVTVASKHCHDQLVLRREISHSYMHTIVTRQCTRAGM